MTATTESKKKAAGEYGAKDITFWKSDLDKIRARPQMYIGTTTGTEGIFSTLREVLDNCLDEYQAGFCKACHIEVSDDLSTFTVKDDGRGIPTEIHPKAGVSTLTVVLTHLQTSGKINAGKGKAYEHSIGCFVGETEIPLADGTFTDFNTLYRMSNEGKNLASAVPPVPSWNLKGNMAGAGLIKHIQLSKYVSEVVDLKTTKGTRLRCTTDHPFFRHVIGGVEQVHACKLKKGDLLLCYGDKDPDTVEEATVISLSHPVAVYGIEVTPHHTYAVGSSGVIVSNTHGVGMKATNALSEKFEVVTCNKGKWFATKFAKGKEVLKPSPTKAPAGMKQGTMVRFTPDLSVFKKYSNVLPNIKAWAKLSASLNPGVKITLTHKGKTEQWHEPAGIKALILSEAERLKAEPIGKMFEYHSSHMDLALLFTNAEGDMIDAYTNTVKNVEGGVHLDALKSALYEVLKPFLRKNEKMTPNDLLEGVIGVLNYKIAAPRFDSQTKEKLVDERVGVPCREECVKALTEFFAKNKKMADQIVLQAVQLREATNEFRKNKELTRKLKTSKKLKVLLPEKLTAAVKCAPAAREVYAVEGDSAAGCAKQARFPDYQEIYALRGKFMNAMRASPNQLFASDEVIGLLQAIGYNPDLKDPMANLRVGKVLWLADADADGAHINTLGLTLLYRVLPEMFDMGMVYIVAASEFTGTSDKGVRLYADSMDELKAQNAGKTPKDAMHLKGWGEVSPQALREMAFDPKTRKLIKVLPPKDGGEEFTLLMEDNVEYRRQLLGV